MEKTQTASEEKEEENDIDGEGEMEMEEAALNNEERRRVQKIMIRVVYGNHDKGSSSYSSLETCCCQADECGGDLRMAKKYNQRHKVCERHSKAPVVLVSSIRQRFCQQCSKLQSIDDDIDEFLFGLGKGRSTRNLINVYRPL